jgi:hypothetical protein
MSDDVKRCCGTCRHLQWRGDEGECQGGWIVNYYGKHVRPIISCKGMGYGCQTWRPVLGYEIPKL